MSPWTCNMAESHSVINLLKCMFDVYGHHELESVFIITIINNITRFMGNAAGTSLSISTRCRKCGME